MPFRPNPEFRRNINGVVLPLTAAIARVYGIRESDGAYPLGAFYTENIDTRVWLPVGGIWYQPINAEKVANRRISEARIEQFVDGIGSGREVLLNNDVVVSWERIPEALAQLLPSIR
jgi:hypothetical protein